MTDPETVAAVLVDPAAPTPPLADFLDAYHRDDNLWWMLGSGHHQNLFEEAVAERDVERARADKMCTERDGLQIANSFEYDRAEAAETELAQCRADCTDWFLRVQAVKAERDAERLRAERTEAMLAVCRADLHAERVAPASAPSPTHNIERRCQAIMALLRERTVQLADDNALHGLAMELQYAIARADAQRAQPPSR